MEKIITFDDGVKEEILSFFNKSVDEEGYIIEKDSGERVLASDGEDLEINQFAGIRNGSLVFVKSDISSIIKLADSISKK